MITLSSGEAELAGVVKGAAEAIGIRSLSADLGWECPLKLFADSSAAIGICKRTGIGKVRHLAVGQLWVQERLETKDFELYKVLGTENPADILTKHVPREVLDKHLTYLQLHRETGRAATAPMTSS